MVTGETITLTLTATDDVVVAQGAYVEIVIDGVTKQLVYNPIGTTSTSVLFEYEVVAGDVALVTEVTIGTNVNGSVVQTNGTYSKNVTATFVAVDATAVTMN